MKPHRIRLLITLVLFAGTLITAWTATHAEAAGISKSVSSSAKSGGIIFSGDPDSGGGYAPPPASNKGLRKVPVGGQPTSDWIRWASWFWATLLTRAAK
jgi:hypothetical protein